ncbi:MAG: hypothetical protein JWP66_56 [Naasia sp.]|nr:hypothetical protein [Naasia sp.]
MDVLSLLMLVPMLAAVALWVAASVSISRAGLGGTELAVWVLIVLVAPFLGAILWFLVGRPRAASGLRS